MAKTIDNPQANRREFFGEMGTGLYAGALAYLLGRDLHAPSIARAEESPPATPSRVFDPGPRTPHFEPRAKSVIHLFMNGGPSQMDMFDPKPMLDKHHGEEYFDKIAGDVENPFAAGALMRSPFEFDRHGKSDIWMSELLPELSKHVDDMAFIRSMYTNNLTHETALYKIHSGRLFPGNPSLGSWVVYGLGSENQNLPAYVVLDDPKGLPINGIENWQAGYLPPLYQGTRFRSNGPPVLHLEPESPQPVEVSKLRRELLSRLDRIHKDQRFGQPQLDARIASYELAARMQLAASAALDFSDEPKETLEMYGIGQKETDSYGRRCLLARRLVERGVRFVQIFIEYQIWDHHGSIEAGLKRSCKKTDRPAAALLHDLKRSGLFDDTLVVWGGEFGRLPLSQLSGKKDLKTAGRDHNKNAFTTWMAGAGIKRGTVYGATDDFGFASVENRVAVQDWHATILHLLGLDHEKLVFERNGLEEKLTGVFETRVVKEILA